MEDVTLEHPTGKGANPSGKGLEPETGKSKVAGRLWDSLALPRLRQGGSSKLLQVRLSPPSLPTACPTALGPASRLTILTHTVLVPKGQQS